jgi:hypothetical protein
MGFFAVCVEAAPAKRSAAQAAASATNETLLLLEIFRVVMANTSSKAKVKRQKAKVKTERKIF